MLSLIRDLRHTLRQSRMNPTLTATAVITLALGIGANTAVFSVINAVLLRFLPVPNPQQLVYLQTTAMPRVAWETGNPSYTFNLASFEQMRAEHQVFSDLMAFVPLGIGKVPVRFGKEPEVAAGDMVSGNFFSGLGVRVARGRLFSLQDEDRHSQVAVLSYNCWTRRFARNPSVIGQTIYIKSVPFTVMGVAARDFFGVEPGEGNTDFWIPFQTNPTLKPWGLLPQESGGLYGSPSWRFLMLLGRLQPGMTWQAAVAQLTPVSQRAAYEGIGAPSPGEQLPRLYFSATGGIEKLRENYDNPLTILMAMVSVVLLIACINVAMLLVARNDARQREFILRVALGASRLRLFRQLLTEGVLLASAGALLAWLFARWATPALAVWSGLDINVAPDQTVLAFTLVIALPVALVLGLAPLRRVAHAPAAFALKASGSAVTEGRDKFRGGQAVVASQIALCMVLLVGAGLLVRTLRNLQTTNLGFRASGLLVFGITAPQTLNSGPEVLHFFQTLTERLRALPGVESATVMGNRIGSGWSNNQDVLVDGVDPSGGQGAMVRWNDVGPDYCHVLGIRLLQGRDFAEADSATAPRVAVINKTFAERYLPGRNPIGHQITIGKAQPFTIVGIAADSKYSGVREEAVPMAYFSNTQMGGGATMTVVLRAYGNPTALLPEVRRAVAEFGPDVPLMEPMTQQAQLEESYSEERWFARLATSFGLLAALLVASGLYGTLAYKANRRRAEIGVRMALGAQRRQVLWMVLGESATLGLVGVVLGMPLAAASARLLRSILFGLGPGDPLTFAMAMVGVFLLTLLAGYIPARRAAKVDPMVALRYE